MLLTQPQRHILFYMHSGWALQQRWAPSPPHGTDRSARLLNPQTKRIFAVAPANIDTLEMRGLIAAVERVGNEKNGFAVYGLTEAGRRAVELRYKRATGPLTPPTESERSA